MRSELGREEDARLEHLKGRIMSKIEACAANSWGPAVCPAAGAFLLEAHNLSSVPSSSLEGLDAMGGIGQAAEVKRRAMYSAHGAPKGAFEPPMSESVLVPGALCRMRRL